jgi:membrane protein
MIPGIHLLRVSSARSALATLWARHSGTGRGRVHTRSDRTRRRVGLLVARHEDALVLRVSRRMMAINGYDRALALAAQAFAGLIPVLIVVSGFSTHSVRASAGPAVIAALGLTGDAATAVSALVARQPAVEPLTVVGGILLVVSVLGFTRALQRAYLSAWGLPSTGLRGLCRGFLAATALIVGFAALVAFGPAFAVLDGHIVVELIFDAVVATLLWWPIQHVLLGGRVGWRALLPGAALNGCGQAVVIGLSAIYLPSAISDASAQYGLIGVAVPVISWLVVLGLLLVLSAIMSAELARKGPEDVPQESVETDT